MTGTATQSEKQARLVTILASTPVMPVVTIDDVDDAVPMARALVAGGIGVIEIALRTHAGIDSVRAIVAHVPDAVVGAGTVLDADQIDAAAAAGARFLVSPGASPKLLEAAERSNLPWLPGVATASEAMALLERGYRQFKFFPAAAAGGVKWLSAVRAPLPQARFCPTGGVNAVNAADYLRLSNVACVGGSWLAPRTRIAAHAWRELEATARSALTSARATGRIVPAAPGGAYAASSQ